MAGIAAFRLRSRYLIAAGLVFWLLLPAAGTTAGFTAVETLPGPHARICDVQVNAGEARLEVRGHLRLLPAPLPDSNVGRIVLEAVADGRTLARRDAVVYRLVTADRRARLFGFRATLPVDMPDDTRLRIHRVPPGK